MPTGKFAISLRGRLVATVVRDGKRQAMDESAVLNDIVIDRGPEPYLSVRVAILGVPVQCVHMLLRCTESRNVLQRQGRDDGAG